MGKNIAIVALSVVVIYFWLVWRGARTIIIAQSEEIERLKK